MVDYGQLLKGVQERFEPAARAKGIALDLRLPAETFPVALFPDLVEMALENLLDNALRFTPAGGQVTLALERDPGSILTRIEDTGGGIPPEDLERIFQRFFSRAPGGAPSTGNGLGLPIARAAVEKHGGTLTAENLPGGGASFKIFLPAP